MATKQKWYFKLAGDTIGRGFDSSIVLEVWGISREYCFLHSAHFPVNWDYVKESSYFKMADGRNSSENSVSDTDNAKVSAHNQRV